MGKFLAGLFLVGIVVLAYFGIAGAIKNFYTGYDFQNKVKADFDLADQASSASQKSFYFDKFVQDMRREGLTSGDTALWFPTVNSRLEHIFNNTLSLQDRLHGIVQACSSGATLDCNTALQQVTLQEFCWFPIDNIKSGYMIQHGAWGAAGSVNLTPQDQTNRCASSSSSHGSTP